MTKRDSPERRREILGSLLKLLRDIGVAGASTAKIAAQANCSKETLYKWFGDRTGLFSSLAEEQSRAMNEILKASLSGSADIRESLISFAAALLDLLTGEASLLVNRAAIGEMGGENPLAHVVLEKGRGNTAHFAQELLVEARAQNLIQFDEVEEVFSTFFGLIIADRQIRAILGAPDSRPEGLQMRKIAERAVDRLLLIYN